MENSHIILFLYMMIPLAMMLPVFRDHSRVVLAFLLAGIFIGLFSGEVNGLFLKCSSLSEHFIVVNVSPVTEEVLKAIPLVVVAFLYRPSKQHILEDAVAIGMGFATFENVCLLFGEEQISLGWALSRGFGAGLMHAICTLAIGVALSNILDRKNLHLTGTFAALSIAIIYHSIYNILVQSTYYYLGLVLPVLSFLPLLFSLQKKRGVQGFESNA